MKTIFELSLDEGLGDEDFHTLYSTPKKVLDTIRELAEELDDEISEENELQLKWLEKNEKSLLRKIRNIKGSKKLNIVIPGDGLGFFVRKKVLY